ncbi:hypothetical protein BDZ94DRAFT_962073 [Collybia nuda]|uniref:Proteophosphoglycan ppg4 n=1 Tax=Collybia nuda TaxID=64659 RepID=A0A9P6CPC4_9AGAR|nr:hypothetical protein BDZ94DRAFT_962073 [Collybia nuda]
MSRQSTPDHPPNRSTPGSSPVDQRGDLSEQPSSSSPHLMSEESEGYPSWLPKRPPPPPPASTFHSSVGAPESGPSEPPPFMGGRKPTPRSVRIVSLQESYLGKSRREPTDQTRVGNPARAWSRATGATLSPAVFSSGEAPYEARAPQPKFHSRGLHLELLRSPTLKSRFYFYLFPFLVFAHIPIQTFFDFNAVFILLQVSKFPNPQAPGVPGSGRNWALGAAAYIACWLVWIILVFVVYELVFSFIRRWRIKRPLMLPIYLSSPSFNLVALSSYSNFCFLQHIRYSAFFGENGSLRDGIAETFWYYSQNLPTVALLLPRAGLALALLLAFTTPQAGVVALADAGVSHRDGTFFRKEDGTLTNYARGVLIANAAWTAWRALVLLTSYIGLWVVSGQGCAGLCGPRYRWEEEDAEKTKSFYSDTASDMDVLPWSWRECTRMRIQEAYDFCLTVRPALRWNSGKKGLSDAAGLLDVPQPDTPFEGMDQVMAAVGFPSVPPPARRGVLSGELFESPKEGFAVPELSDIIPKVVKRSSKDKQGNSPPLLSLPYPFTAQGAQMSSADRVPFPPSPVPGGSKRTTPSGSTEDDEDDDDSDDEDDDDDDDDDDEDDDEGDNEESEEPSTGRASGSMSSLGQPVTSRYPFQFRRPARGNSMSSGAPSHMTPTSNSRSMQSRISQATQSTGNRESTDSHSPRSHASSSDMASLGAPGGIPMPPRHPQQAQGRGRPRAGTVPAFTSPSPAPIVFPKVGRPRAQTGTAESLELLGAAPYGSEMDHDLSDSGHSSEASHEAAERQDTVGLLSAAPSPRTSLRHRGSNVSQTRSGSNSRTNSHSGSSSSRSRPNSVSVSVRSRAQSLMQNIGAASHSSLELVQTAIRSRANSSMARLEEDSPYYSDARTHSRSGSGSDALHSGNENYTFGHPPRMNWPVQVEQRVEEEPADTVSSPPSPSPMHTSHSDVYLSAPSLAPSETTPQATVFSQGPGTSSSSPIEIPVGTSGGRGMGVVDSAASSPPDISTAAGSFVTAPATISGTTESSERTVSSWGGITHMVDRSDATWRPA